MSSSCCCCSCRSFCPHLPEGGNLSQKATLGQEIKWMWIYNYHKQTNTNKQSDVREKWAHFLKAGLYLPIHLLRRKGKESSSLVICSLLLCLRGFTASNQLITTTLSMSNQHRSDLHFTPRLPLSYSEKEKENWRSRCQRKKWEKRSGRELMNNY